MNCQKVISELMHPLPLPLLLELQSGMAQRHPSTHDDAAYTIPWQIMGLLTMQAQK